MKPLRGHPEISYGMPVAKIAVLERQLAKETRKASRLAAVAKSASATSKDVRLTLALQKRVEYKLQLLQNGCSLAEHARRRAQENSSVEEYGTCFANKEGQRIA